MKFQNIKDTNKYFYKFREEKEFKPQRNNNQTGLIVIIYTIE